MLLGKHADQWHRREKSEAIYICEHLDYTKKKLYSHRGDDVLSMNGTWVLDILMEKNKQNLNLATSIPWNMS